MSDGATIRADGAPPTIRPARASDLEDLVEIYNHYVRETIITFDLEPYTVEKRRPWFEAFAEKGPHRLLVAESEVRVLGYAGTTKFRVKAAYARSVEMTVYLDHTATGRGIGVALYTELLEELAAEPSVHSAYAGISLPNDASVALHRRFGFEDIGVFREVGFKFGAYIDVLWMEKALEGPFTSRAGRA